jgi:TRAP-type uncharacterized transport system substrate-binding protein
MKGWTMKMILVVMGLTLVASACAPEKAKPPSEIVNLEIYTTAAGSPPYFIGITIAEMLRDLHPWLKASPLEALSVTDAVASSHALPPERQKYAVITGLDRPQIVLARRGIAPHTRKHPGLKLLAIDCVATFAFASYDPEIKSSRDMIGKRVGLIIRGASPTPLSVALLREAWGIYDQVKISYHRPIDFKDVLTAGVADAAWLNLGSSGEEGVWTTAPWTREATGARRTYWISTTQEDIERINKSEEVPWKAFLTVVPKGAWGGGEPREDVGGVSFVSYIGVWDVMDEEVAYELVKLLGDNAAEYTRRMQGKTINDRWILDARPDPMMSEEDFHPGTLRYFNEKGIKIG